MSEPKETQRGQTLVATPPVRRLISDRGAVPESQVLVGWIDAGPGHREKLEEYGVCLDFAEWDPETERWEQCLFSEACADTLMSLYELGELPWQLEAGLSMAEAEWRLMAARGLTERPSVPVWRYLTPSPPALLRELATREYAREQLTWRTRLRMVRGPR